MFFSQTLKRFVILSLGLHFIIFSIFGLTFGKRYKKLNFNEVYFLGDLLKSHDFLPPANSVKNLINEIFSSPLVHKVKIIPEDTKERVWQDVLKKPAVNFALEKALPKIPVYAGKELLSLEKKDSFVMFYPALPGKFNLYFKGRQTAHIELTFAYNLNNAWRREIFVKRIISSGNLEADLLSMRYLKRYLIMQQHGSTNQNWQKVKIDLGFRK